MRLLIIIIIKSDVIKKKLSDLTCVLFLSGLQRNDSDDNALRKLHGRNQNIHYANNEYVCVCMANAFPHRVRTIIIKSNPYFFTSDRLPKQLNLTHLRFYFYKSICKIKYRHWKAKYVVNRQNQKFSPDMHQSAWFNLQISTM